VPFTQDGVRGYEKQAKANDHTRTNEITGDLNHDGSNEKT